METRKSNLSVIINLTILVLFVAVSVSAMPIAPVSYDMMNGASAGGNFQYWDESYSGTGSINKNFSLLSGGLGDLTDGIIATKNWYAAESPVGSGPYVGWYKNPTIVFHFGSLVQLNALTLYLDDSYGYGGVSLPGSITLDMGETIANYSVYDDPTIAQPISVTLSNLSLFGNTLTLTLNRKSNWIFLSEVTFDGTPAIVDNFATAPVPEPGTMLLFGAGLVGLAGYNWCRKRS